MKVLKFGGSSVGTPAKARAVKQIIEAQNEPVVVVISALQGVTNQLEKLSIDAATQNGQSKTTMQQLATMHTDFITELGRTTDMSMVLSSTETNLNQLQLLIDEIEKSGEISPQQHDVVLGYGEVLSSAILQAILPESVYLNSRGLIKTDDRFGNARVLFDETNALITEAYQKANARIVIAPGFIASTKDGIPTTLGRGGSDYTASIYAAALNASRLEIWTDVDGFMTADPKKVSKALAIDKLSYSEAMELSHFGARVIYTPTIQPVYQKNIPIAIRNTFNPKAEGTLISNMPGQDTDAPIRGVSSIDDIDLITLQGPGLVGVQGISSRLFGVIASKKINVILITQASSEYSITFAVSPTDTQKAVSAIEKEFEQEITLGKSIHILVEKDLSIVAIVGEQMKNTPGISATLFSSLARNGISVIATAQGSSELNISVVIKNESLKKGLNAIHEDFFLSHIKELHLYIVGVGTVGGSLLKQIKDQQQYLLDELQLKINVVGISRTRKMLIEPEGIDLDNYLGQLEENGQATNMAEFIEAISENNLRNSVFIDCTADDNLAKHYQNVLNSYASIVTANKVACSGDYQYYRDLKKTAQKHNVKFMFETNVGAGLPIISTIKDLIRSGDKIISMEAVLSGTLNFIFNELSENISLSKAIQLAKEKGFSEPDPRIDLSGIDVVRKLLILSREWGYALEKDDVDINPFLPSDCFDGTLDDFWEKVKAFDAPFEKERQRLVAENKKWRFVAKLNQGKASVSLEEVDIHHPAFPLEGSNNILLLTTKRYNEAPMVIRGYGAGAEVTAAGVFADIVRVANV